MTAFRPGRTAARFFKSLAVSKGDVLAAGAFAEAQNWTDTTQIKAAITALSTGNTSSLVQSVGDDFAALVYPATIIGRLDKLRRVPLQTRLVRQTAGATAAWVHETSPKPIAAATFADEGKLPARKVIALSVISEELARASNAETLIIEDLRKAAVSAVDEAFIDAANAGEQDEKPASVAHGATSIPSTGDPALDVAAALAAFGGDLSQAAWVMHPQTAAALNLRGAPFDKLHALGGTLVGLPVLTSSSCPDDVIVLLDQGGIELGGADSAQLRTSTEASVQMVDNPDTGASSLVSLWQTNCMALLAELTANWRLAQPGAVVCIAGAVYAEGAATS